MDRRAFLTTTLAGGALALAGKTFAAAPRSVLSADAARLSGSAVRVTWAGAADPVSIFVSSDADAKTALRPLKADARQGAAEVDAAVTPRPYFLLKSKDGAETRVAERLLPLKGGRNFRDLGGYRSEDGRQVRWGRIYRSGVMNGLTAADIDYLGKLGVGVICDLRNPQERVSEPSPFLNSAATKVIAFDYDMSTSLGGFAAAKTRADAIAAFAAAYVDFIETLTPQYADMFARLVRNEGPLAMNCSAGKDRTGVGSALVLSVLGVPRETVLADYGLTQVYTPPSLYLSQVRAGAAMPGLTAAQSQMLSRLPREVLEVMMGSDPEIMRQALAGIDRRYGGPVALTKTRFGLTDASIARLRSLYLA